MALDTLAATMHEADAALTEMRAERDPLALHIFVSRRSYQNMPDTQSGKNHARAALASWRAACDLGFRGDLREWVRLLDAVAKR
ncbi:MAG TPA: hypothetical protein VK474_06150 [Chthoniobacterales bacterium]|nr:hypothetical protein [Chthoniobacterales bacterium]